MSDNVHNLSLSWSDVKDILKELIEIRRAIDQFYDEDERTIVLLDEAAGDRELYSLDKFFESKQMKTPSSLGGVLSEHNGIDDLVGYDFRLLSVGEITSRHLYLAEEELEELTEQESEDFSNNLDIIIGGGTSTLLGIDRTNVRDDDTGVILLTPDFEIVRFDSLRAFLEMISIKSQAELNRLSSRR